MAAADPGGPGPDLYELLGVSRESSREAIAQAWRRQARAEHPDSRPGDAAAPDRFRALAEAWHVLSDPARRAAYDQALGPQQTSFPRYGETQHPARPPATRMPGSPPLWAGPTHVEGPYSMGVAGRRDDEEIRLAILAGLTLRYLVWDGDWPW